MPEPPAADQTPAAGLEGAALNRDLLALADEFERKARDYRARASMLQSNEDMRRETEELMERLWAIPEVVQAHLDKGLCLADAQGAASVETGFRMDTIEVHWRRHLREEKQAARLRRNQTIIGMARKGWPCRRIAAAFDSPLCATTVATVIKREGVSPPAPGSLPLKAGASPPPARAA